MSYTLPTFATSSGAASWAEQTAVGPVSVLLESLAKSPVTRQYEWWLNVATLTVDGDGTHFDVRPIREIGKRPSAYASHAELRRAMKAGSHA